MVRALLPLSSSMVLFSFLFSFAQEKSLVPTMTIGEWEKVRPVLTTQAHVCQKRKNVRKSESSRVKDCVFGDV